MIYCNLNVQREKKCSNGGDERSKEIVSEMKQKSLSSEFGKIVISKLNIQLQYT